MLGYFILLLFDKFLFFIVLTIYYAKNSVKIYFSMTTAKNGFQILNLHPKKHVGPISKIKVPVF